MDNKSYDKFLINQDIIKDNRQVYDKKIKKQDSKLDKLVAMIKKMMDQIIISNSSPDNIYSPKSHDPTSLVPASKKAPQFEVGHSTKIDGMLTLKNEISSKIYEILIKTKPKNDIALDLKNFHNHINMSLSVMNRIREDLIPDYQFTKRHSEFEE